MVKSILKTINKKRLVISLPMPLAKIQSTITDLLPLPPILPLPDFPLLALSKFLRFISIVGYICLYQRKIIGYYWAKFPKLVYLL